MAKKNKKTYQVGDIVVYGINGICEITKITRRPFNEKLVRYYVLTPLYNNNNSVFYVPTENEEVVAKLRFALTSREIKTLIKKMPEEECEWIENDNDRKVRFKEIIYSSDSHEMVKLIKTIYLHQEENKLNGKKIHMSDERFFKDAERLVYNEFAHALKIEPDEVMSFIKELIESDKTNKRLTKKGNKNVSVTKRAPASASAKKTDAKKTPVKKTPAKKTPVKKTATKPAKAADTKKKTTTTKATKTTKAAKTTKATKATKATKKPAPKKTPAKTTKATKKK